MLEHLIQEKAHQVSYNAVDFENITRTASRLRHIVDGSPDFGDAFLGGAFLRHTLVKNVCDLELYFEYRHPLNAPSNALSLLMTCLTQHHTRVTSSPDNPSLTCEAEGLRFELVPFIKDTLGNTKIPAEDMSGWKITYSRPLEEKIRRLSMLNPRFLELVRLIKYWNHCHRISMTSHRIEEITYSIFAHEPGDACLFSEWLWTFFNQAPCYLSMYDFKAFHLFQDTLGKLNYSRDKMHQLMTLKKDENTLAKNWNAFIENQAVGEKVE